MLRNKTEIHCDNCAAEIPHPINMHKLTYFGMRQGRSVSIKATLCQDCADGFASRFPPLFERPPVKLWNEA